MVMFLVVLTDERVMKSWEAALITMDTAIPTRTSRADPPDLESPTVQTKSSATMAPQNAKP